MSSRLMFYSTHLVALVGHVQFLEGLSGVLDKVLAFASDPPDLLVGEGKVRLQLQKDVLKDRPPQKRRRWELEMRTG